MASVRAAGTKPEVIVRQVAHRLGYRFRLHRTNLPGRPDLVFPRHRKIILVHGCFWHGHENCKKAKRPDRNAEFWNRKLSQNIERDRQTVAALTDSGWQILIVWECETKRTARLSTRVLNFLRNGRTELA